MQRLFETYEPKNYDNYKLKKGAMHPNSHRYKDLNTNLPNSKRYERSTVGSFTVYDTSMGNKEVFKCFCVENEGPSESRQNYDLRIMPGDYHICWTYTSTTLPDIPATKYGGKKRGLLTMKANEKNVVSPDGWIERPGPHAARRVIIHIGQIPQHSEACILLVSGLFKAKNPKTGEQEYTGKGYSSGLANTGFYNLVDRYGPQNFLLQVVETGDPPPPPYETEAVEGGDYSDAGEDTFDPMDMPSFERMEHRMNTKNGYYDLKIDFSTTI